MYGVFPKGSTSLRTTGMEDAQNLGGERPVGRIVIVSLQSNSRFFRLKNAHEDGWESVGYRACCGGSDYGSARRGKSFLRPCRPILKTSALNLQL